MELDQRGRLRPRHERIACPANGMRFTRAGECCIVKCIAYFVLPIRYVTNYVLHNYQWFTYFDRCSIHLQLGDVNSFFVFSSAISISSPRPGFHSSCVSIQRLQRWSKWRWSSDSNRFRLITDSGLPGEILLSS